MQENIHFVPIVIDVFSFIIEEKFLGVRLIKAMHKQ